MHTSNDWLDWQIIRGPFRGEMRNRAGLTLKLRARPDIEDYMRGASNDHRVLVEAVSDGWVKLDSQQPALEAYDMHIPASRGYTLDGIGMPMFVNHNDGRLRHANADELLNLSFLRLVGISNPEGVTVGITGAYSLDYVTRVRASLQVALKQFLQDYLVPITINLHVMSKDSGV